MSGLTGDGSSARDDARDASRGNGNEGKGHARAPSAGALGAAGAGGGENGEAMEVDTGEEGEDGFGRENGGIGQAGAVAGAVGAGAANGDGSGGALRKDEDGVLATAEEIPEGDVAVLSNHRSEVSAFVFRGR